ncbi:MAG: hypothetical protein WB611_02385 [Stellaceae bacterium]
MFPSKYNVSRPSIGEALGDDEIANVWDRAVSEHKRCSTVKRQLVDWLHGG